MTGVAALTAAVLAVPAGAQPPPPVVAVHVAPAAAGAAAAVTVRAVGGAAGSRVAVSVADFHAAAPVAEGALIFATDGVAELSILIDVARREEHRRLIVRVGAGAPPRRRLAPVPVVDPEFRLRRHARSIAVHPRPGPGRVFALRAAFLGGAFTTAYRRLYWPADAAATVWARFVQVPENATRRARLSVLVCDVDTKRSARVGDALFTATSADPGTYVTSFNVTGNGAWWRIYYQLARGSGDGGEVFIDRLLATDSSNATRPDWWTDEPYMHLHATPYHDHGSC